MSRYTRALVGYRSNSYAYTLRQMGRDAGRTRGDPVIRWFLRIWGGIMIALVLSFVVGAAIIVAGGLSG